MSVDELIFKIDNYNQNSNIRINITKQEVENIIAFTNINAEYLYRQLVEQVFGKYVMQKFAPVDYSPEDNPIESVIYDFLLRHKDEIYKQVLLNFKCDIDKILEYITLNK